MKEKSDGRFGDLRRRPDADRKEKSFSPERFSVEISSALLCLLCSELLPRLADVLCALEQT